MCLTECSSGTSCIAERTSLWHVQFEPAGPFFVVDMMVDRKDTSWLYEEVLYELLLIKPYPTE